MPPLAYVADRHTKATLAETPSLSRNNLTAGPSLLGVVHNAQTLMVPVARALAGDAVEKLPIFTKDGNREIFQAKVVVLGADVFFVLCTATRVLVYDQKGYMLRHSRAVPGSPSAVAGPSGEFSLVNHARGVCSACSADARAFVCVGTARGSVLVVETTARAAAAAGSTSDTTLPSPTSLRGRPPRRRAAAPPPRNLPRLRRRGGPGRGLERPERRSIRAEPVPSRRARGGARARGDAVIVADVSGVELSGSPPARVLQMQAHHTLRDGRAPDEGRVRPCAEDGTLAVWGMPSEGGAGGGAIRTRVRGRVGGRHAHGVAFCGEGDCRRRRARRDRVEGVPVDEGGARGRGDARGGRQTSDAERSRRSERRVVMLRCYKNDHLPLCELSPIFSSLFPTMPAIFE